MNKTITIALTLLLALGGLTAFVPAVTAQADEVVVSDPAGDAQLYPGTSSGIGAARPPPPSPSGVTVPAGANDPADLTGFRIFGETATTISFEMSVADFSRPNTYQPSKLYYALCFDWSGTGGTYRFWWDFSFSAQPQAEANSYPRFGLGTFARMDTCEPVQTTGRTGELMTQTYARFTHAFDPVENKITWTVPRRLFEELHPENSATGAVDPRPMAGETLSNVRLYAVTQAASAYATFDEAGPAEFTFKLDTGNEKVKVVIPANVQAGTGFGGFDTPIYGVEIGNFQTVPVTVENYLDTPIEPNITVTMLSGEASKWEVRTLPSIPVPAMVGEEPGRATVTLIVNSDPTISHKESVRLLVTALDQKQPDHLGAQAVDIVAVQPPLVGAATLYFHGGGNPCETYGRWINTLQQDASGTAPEIPFQSCSPDGAGGGGGVAGEGSYTFRPDVPFARDYVLSTSGANAKATLVLRSIQRAPGSSGTEVPVPMVANILVQLLSGNTVIGEKEILNTEIPGQATPFNIEIPIQGQILGGFGREVPNDKGLGVRVSIAPAARVIEIGGCVQEVCVPEDEREVQSTGGKVFMAYGASNIVLPIVSSERSGDIINITKSGALMSLRLSEGDRNLLTNPGRIVVYNLTVRNEGVNVDTARISAVLNQTGWKVEILPTTTFKLKVGQPRSFNVRVVAPADAVEGESLRIDLFATSTVDKNAVAKLPLTVSITTGEQFPDHEIDENLQKLEEQADSPGIGVPFLVLALLGLLGVARTRRRL